MKHKFFAGMMLLFSVLLFSSKANAQSTVCVIMDENSEIEKVEITIDDKTFDMVGSVKKSIMALPGVYQHIHRKTRRMCEVPTGECVMKMVLTAKNSITGKKKIFEDTLEMNLAPGETAVVKINFKSRNIRLERLEDKKAEKALNDKKFEELPSITVGAGDEEDTGAAGTEHFD